MIYIFCILQRDCLTYVLDSPSVFMLKDMIEVALSLNSCKWNFFCLKMEKIPINFFLYFI